ncbi:hypothetical protein H2200_000412 [Cladophialophora chaetospira]|uniref:Uncharacterized protein n=1 Tax=Cladophialophora chaetospira TaxID=386627 RepID=A0AA38XNC7_9EURO|nr:hypothetical protein H2200_000412 [Cladophialophora chaetospira]
MSSILNKLKVERSEGMAGIGSDQGALKEVLEKEEASLAETRSKEKDHEANNIDEIGSGKGEQLDRAPNTAGGPSFGRTSTIPRHESEGMNKVDPRIGYDSDEVRDKDLESYEAKRFSRSVFTKDQIKTAELQKTPHTPNQVVTEVPHSTEPSFIDVPSPLWYHRMGPVKDFFGWFSRMQRRRPLATAAGTSMTTYLFGDLLAQGEVLFQVAPGLVGRMS